MGGILDPLEQKKISMHVKHHQKHPPSNLIQTHRTDKLKADRFNCSKITLVKYGWST